MEVLIKNEGFEVGLAAIAGDTVEVFVNGGEVSRFIKILAGTDILDLDVRV